MNFMLSNEQITKQIINKSNSNSSASQIRCKVITINIDKLGSMINSFIRIIIIVVNCQKKYNHIVEAILQTWEF